MKRMVTKFSSTLQLLLLCITVNAQNYDAEAIQKCPLIVEAHVVDQEYRYDPEDPGDIQTLNYLEISEYLKGNNFTNRIAIVTEGGIMDDIFQTVSHVPRLSIGQEGIFFLEPVEDNSSESITRLYNGEDRKLLYISDLDHEVYCTHTHNYHESKGLLKQEIRRNSVDFIESELLESEVCLSIENIQPDLTNSKVRFDVKIKANAPGYRFSELRLDFAYPTKNLEKYIVTNGNLNLSRGSVIKDEFYELNYSDIDTSQVSVRITTDCNSGSSVLSNNYYVLSTSYEKLLTAEVNVAEWGSYGEMTIESFELNGRAKYAVSDGRCVDFNNLCTEDNEFQFKNCSITSFDVAPFGAGVQQIMSIKGMCFSTAGVLKIPNADDGGASKITIQSTDTRWIKSWTDTLIRVLVSSIAPGDHPMGSGEWEVHPDINMMCMDAVDVEYSISNSYVAPDERMNSIATAYSPPFVNNDSYKWYIDSLGIVTKTFLIAQSITYNDVLDVCQAAFCDWEMASGLEFEFAGVNNMGYNPNDQMNTITFSNILNDTLAVTTTIISMGLCDTMSDPYIDGRLRDADIRINENKQWFVSTTNSGITSVQYDLYGVLLHEIGHMMLMKHACDIPLNGTMDDRLMYPFLNPMQIKRTIDAKTINGINEQKTRTQNALSGCLDEYLMNTMTDMCLTPVSDIGIDIKMRFTNPVQVTENINIEFETAIDHLTIFDINGRKVNEVRNDHSSDNVIIPGIKQSGLYFIYAQKGSQSITKKIIIL